tara:strand:+ start:272 stop:535 length:264 start_codon:yes stop_codon:yes gene_type:complete
MLLIFTVLGLPIILGYYRLANSNGLFIPLMLFCAYPLIALMVRRIHDIGKSAWWLLIAFTVIGLPVLWNWFSLPSEEADNKYGTYNP